MVSEPKTMIAYLMVLLLLPMIFLLLLLEVLKWAGFLEKNDIPIYFLNLFCFCLLKSKKDI